MDRVNTTMTSAAHGKRVQRDASAGNGGSRSTSADHNVHLPLMNAFSAASDYWIDAVQRSVMFFDVLRQQGNNYFEHEAAGKPPLLGFGYEVEALLRSWAGGHYSRVGGADQ